MKNVKLVFRTIATILVLILIGCVFLLLAHIVFKTFVSLFGISWDFSLTMVCLIVLKLFLPAKWQVIPVRFSMRGRALIDTNPAEVWARMYPQAGGDYFLTTVDHIKSAPDRPNGVDIYLDDRLKDEQSQAPVMIQANITHLSKGHSLRLEYQNAENLPLFGKQTESTDYKIEQKGEMVEFQIIENFKGLSISGLLALLFLNPAKDGARRMKALCEGGPDVSVLGGLWTQIENEGPDRAFGNVATIIMATVAVFATMLCLVVAWGVMQLAV